MNATLMLICLSGVSSTGQAPEVVFKAPMTEVREQKEDGKDYLYLLHNRVYMGRNYKKPANRKDYGKPDVDLSRLPTTYYHDKSPIGIVLAKYNWFPGGKDNTYAADARMPASL